MAVGKDKVSDSNLDSSSTGTPCAATAQEVFAILFLNCTHKIGHAGFLKTLKKVHRGLATPVYGQTNDIPSVDKKDATANRYCRAVCSAS